MDHMKRNGSNDKPSHVRRIYVEQLFGHFTYDLSVKPSDPPGMLMILYGDNGTGKTTLLQMLFHLLHPARNRGHRSFLGRKIFRRFEVEFANEIRVVAERAGNNLVGGFAMSVHHSDGAVHSVNWVQDNEGKVVGSKEGDEYEENLLQCLDALNIGIYFLTDDRTIVSTREHDGKEEYAVLFGEEPERRLSPRERWQLERKLQRDLGGLPRALVLGPAIGRVSHWVTQQVIAASSKGEEDANAIYTGIVRRLAHLTEEKSQRKVRPNKTKLIEELRKQAERSAKFSRYGLIAPTSIDTLIASIQSASPNALPAIQDVVKPFIDGLQARLDALRSVHDAVDTFVETLNRFYKDKTVSFGVKTGTVISGSGGEPLAPNVLSSGEKQLLLLFCNLLIARGQDSIFIIDEPELSLNVKWQRQLTSSLLDFGSSSRTQFMLATHSIELITRYRNCVLKLAPYPNV